MPFPLLRLRAALAAVTLLALAALAAGVASQRAQAEPAATFASGAAQVGNSKAGSAILGGALGPGDSLSGSVTISNVGSASGAFSLQLSHLTDTPGAGGGSFSRQLDLAVDDVTNPAAPLAIYRGKLNSLNPTTLGSFGSGESHTYRFVVSWPPSGAADASFYGSSMSVEFDWLASDEVTTTPTSPPPPTQPVPPPPPPPVAPRISASVPGSERVLARRGVLVRGGCDEACTLRTGGTLAIPGASAAFKLPAVSRKVPAGGRVKIVLKLRGRAISRLRAALRSHRRPTVTVTLSAKAASGATSALRRRIRVVG